MLNNRSLDDRTYEELMREALLQIPLYSDEWTNFNPSDPGITMLENLTAFELLQQNRLDQITPAIQQRLLKMAGFESEKGRCARVLLSAGWLDKRLKLPAGKKFRVGDLCFETNKNIELPPCHLTGVYGRHAGETYDCSWLLDREVTIPAYVFGEAPEEGDSIWFTADALPKHDSEVIFYITVADRHNRNPFVKKGNNTFAAVRWECYTQEGFIEMNVRDRTGCFLDSGEVRMRLPSVKAAPHPEAPNGEYVIRAVLQRANYDVRPKLVSVEAFLFEAFQKDTLSMCHIFHRITAVSLSSEILEDGYYMIYNFSESQ